MLILQGSNYIFPLLTFPYLVRILGVESYGILIFTTGLMYFLNIFVDYGFNISGTKYISINKNNIRAVTNKYNLIMTIKWILTILIGIVFLLIIAFPYFSDRRDAFIISFLIIIGNTMFPIWLFQGLEKMKYITYINVFSKILITIMIFVFVKDSQDLNLAVFFQTMYFIIPGIIAIIFIKFKFGIKFTPVMNTKKIVEELRYSKYFFTTNLWINFYVRGPVIILGFLSGNNAVGNFGIGQRIQGAFSGLVQPIVQAVYPYLCELYDKKQDIFNSFKNKLLIIFIILSFLLSLLMSIFSNELIWLVMGESNDKIDLLLRLFSIIIFLSTMNTVMARIMYAMGLQKELNNTYSISAMIFIVLSVPLTILYHDVGMTFVVLLSELIIFILNTIRIKNLKRLERS